MRLAIFALILVPLAATSAAAASAPRESWGKAGVTYERYRQDAVECTSAGYNLDISQTEDAKAFVAASRRLETEIGAGVDPYTYQSIVHNVRPEMRYRDIKQVLQSTVDQCLISRGYTKFRLTDDQRRGIKKLKIGSPERHAYLHSLASNPTVLATQVVPPTQSQQ
jgi:hypothetical protein